MSRFAFTAVILGRMVKGPEKGRTLFQRMTEKPRERIDKDFPLGLRILARVQLDITDYYLAQGYTSMPKPIESGTITAIGVIRDANGFVNYMVYVAPDGLVEDEKMSLLYVETENGKVLATKLFVLADEVFPPSVEDWEVWINEGSGIIGTEMFHTPDGYSYERQWGDGEWASPMISRERKYNDRYGDDISTTELAQMLFARKCGKPEDENAPTEYLLVSVVNEEYIEILKGIPVIITADSIIGA